MAERPFDSGPPRATDMVCGWDFVSAPARARSVRLTASYRAAVGSRDCSDALARFVGEGAAAAVLLMSALRFEGRLSLQLQPGAGGGLLLVQCDEHFGFRALARAAAPGAAEPQAVSVGAGAPLAITLEPAGRGERYQGLVDAVPGSLAATLENYFRQSEQLPTRVCLAADGASAAGILMQAVPEATDRRAWARLERNFETVTAADLLTLDPIALARRRFARETVRVYERGPAFFRCSCSPEGARRLVGALGKEEIAGILAEEGRVELTCEFCGRRYRFDPEVARAAVAETWALSPGACGAAGPPAE